VEQKSSQITLRFNPQKGNDLLFLKLDEVNFHCKELVAEISLDGHKEITLKGLVNDRIPYLGKIKKDSRSEKRVLNYVVDHIDDSLLANDTSLQQTIKEVKDGLELSTKDNLRSTELLENILEVFTSDFDWSRCKRSLSKSGMSLVDNKPKLNIDLNTANEIFESDIQDNINSTFLTSSTRLSLFGPEGPLEPLPYQTISGFLSIEVAESSPALSEEVTPDRDILKLSERIQFISESSRFILTEDGPRLEIDINAHDDISDISFFFHIGKKSMSNQPWIDYEAIITHKDHNPETNTDNYTLSLSLNEFSAGRYEFTSYVISAKHEESLWFGAYGENKTFFISAPRKNTTTETKVVSLEKVVPLSSFEAFSRWCSLQLLEGNSGAVLESLFYQKESRLKISAFYEEALRRLLKRESKRALAVVRMIRTLGLSSVTMVSPEGPHAIAGGLAQVIVGLTESLTQEGLDVTLITPLYEQAWGNHHISSKKALSHGITLFGEKVIPERIGEISINIPATSWESNSGIATPRRVLRVEIYEANVRGVRIIFLRHKNLGDRLYGGISARDQILRAIFLSRGALELCKSDTYGIKPGILLTHDWLTSLISPLLKLDEGYSKSERLSSFTPVHMLHNVGRGYQGRFHVVENGENLWPLLGLDAKHLFGFLDEHETNYINFTKGACYHNHNALITVSKPYADQLLKENSGEGLAKTFDEKRSIFYGISNGIPQDAVRNAGFKRVIPESILLSARIQQRLSKRTNDLDPLAVREYKQKLKSLIQSENSLQDDPNAILAVFVGRLTEQKGLGLLSAKVEDDFSALELALRSYPNFQVIIAGPPSHYDSAFIEFKEYFNALSLKYPGRCSSRFEFVPHAYAIELTAAADLFLMPSRYEPGGITQLEALAVGTTVVAHRVGGLSATLTQFKSTHGTSFLFDEFKSEKFWKSLKDANDVLSDEEKRDQLIERTLQARNGWEHRVPYYLSLFQKVLGVFEFFPRTNASFSSSRLELLSRISVDKQ